MKTYSEIYKALSNVNVNDKVELKGKQKYLSWSYAWGEAKKIYPEVTNSVYENADGWNYHTDGRYGWVKVGVTIMGIESIESFPILDGANRSVKLEAIDQFAVNKAIKRAVVKALAGHGLGLYLYAGEDLPDATAVSDTSEKSDLNMNDTTKKWIADMKKQGVILNDVVKKIRTKRKLSTSDVEQIREVYDALP